MAQPFDTGKLALTGDAVRIAEHVGGFGTSAYFSVSPGGVLAYRTGSQADQFQLTWFDRQGKSLGVFGEPNSDRYPVLSPDGTRATVMDSEIATFGDLWMLDFVRGVRTRFTFRRTSVSPGIWSPDGGRIVFSAGSGFEAIDEKASTGAGEERELLRTAAGYIVPTSWSRDGRLLLYSAINPKYELWVLPREGDRKTGPTAGVEIQ
jgi:Tol biopolymer transport system component